MKQINLSHNRFNKPNSYKDKKSEIETKHRIHKLESMIKRLQHQIEQYTTQEQYINSLIHELRNINRDIKYDTDDLYFEEMSAESKNVWALSNLLTIVMNTYTYQVNRELEVDQQKYPIPIYKKIDKLRRCYNFRRNSTFKIDIGGSSSLQFLATEIIEVLFFIIIENARKYSLPGEFLRVKFNETQDTITITFTNKSKLPFKDEIPNLTTLKYRGSNKCNKGEGIGLNTFADICRIHGVSYEIETKEVATSLDGLPVGDFIIRLTFHNCISPRY